MKTMIFTSSPNDNGLTAACAEAAKAGVIEAGGEAFIVNLNKLNIGNCKSCNNGWGECLSKHECQVVDNFQDLHNSMFQMDAFIFITPVYWGEMSESMKAFTDRLRRCEARNGDKSLFINKPTTCVAAAGGSGNGTLSCLTSMERFTFHVQAERFDLIGITRKTREFKLSTIKESSKSMASL